MILVPSCEGHTHGVEKLLGSRVIVRARHKRDVHAGVGRTFRDDFGEDRVLLKAERVVAASVETTVGNSSQPSSLLDGSATKGAEVRDGVSYYGVDMTAERMVADTQADYKASMNLDALIDQARKDMESAAKTLDFIAAARYRDRMYELQKIKEEQLKNL